MKHSDVDTDNVLHQSDTCMSHACVIPPHNENYQWQKVIPTLHTLLPKVTKLYETPYVIPKI